MDYKRIIFAGFFLKSEDKLKFTRLFNCEKRIFLESSQKFSKYNSELIKYFPMSLFHMQGNKIWNILFKRVELDPAFVDLYKRDLKIFRLSYLKEPLPGGKKTFALFVYWVFRNAFKSGFSFASALDAFRTIINKGKLRNEHDFVREGDTYHHMEALKVFAFRLSFINGYIYVKKMVGELGVGQGDLLVLWGGHNSGARLLLDCWEKKGVSCLIAEYGELPGTFSLNKDGIFGDSQIVKSWSEISTKKSTDLSIVEAKKYLGEIEASQSSSRGISEADQMLSFYREIFQPKESIKKVIYVSGVELLASGHLFNKEFVSPGKPNANEMLLKHVLSHFSSDEYTILYKDHPLMQQNYQELALNASDFKGVVFVNSMNVDNLVSMADITITLPSKVIMTCLMYRKPVYAYGDFSIPETVPALGYYTGRNVADIKHVVDDGCNSINPDVYPEIVSELLQEYLIRTQSPLFESYDFLVEQQKIENIIDSQLTVGK
jgi:hypothetical protein